MNPVYIQSRCRRKTNVSHSIFGVTHTADAIAPVN